MTVGPLFGKLRTGRTTGATTTGGAGLGSTTCSGNGASGSGAACAISGPAPASASASETPVQKITRPVTHPLSPHPDERPLALAIGSWRLHSHFRSG
jgi:hypothetical protein